MCGIAGVFEYRGGTAPDRTLLAAVRDSMYSRGPDSAGIWCSPTGEIALAHRRLAIIDLSEGGTQPMRTVDGRYSIVFNGEIYNYIELRALLVSKGYRFRTRTDTEVLLHLYDFEGDAMFGRLRGMYAFGLWDATRRQLLLARDPYGIKPLYFSDNGKTLWFASQVRALLRALPSATDEPAGHVGYHLWGHVPEPYTLFRGIRAVEPGTRVTVTLDNQTKSKSFWSVTAELAGRTFPAAVADRASEARESLREILNRTVSSHMIADVPVGVFLSAGRDSSTLLALASNVEKAPLRTITVGYDEFVDTPLDEMPLARVTAHRYGAQHSEVRFSREEMERLLPAFLAAMDQPTVDAFNTFLVSRAAAEQGVKVALSGVGADELFCGYSSFESVPRLVARARWAAGLPWIGVGCRLLTAPMIRRFANPKYASLLEYGGHCGGAYLLRRGMFLPWELPHVMDPELVRVGLRDLDPLLDLAAAHADVSGAKQKVVSLESRFYLRNQLLRDTDWASMAHSLEVRTPFVDAFLLRDIVSHAERFGWPTKALMAECPQLALPAELIGRPKTGFALPMNHSKSRPRVIGEPPQRTWARDMYYRYCLDAKEAPRSVPAPAPSMALSEV